MNQLRHDIRHRIYAKHHQWLIDSLNLYDMAELSDKDAFEDTFTVMMSSIISIAKAMGIDSDKMEYLVRKAYEMTA